jgi:hypothetical protein
MFNSEFKCYKQPFHVIHSHKVLSKFVLLQEAKNWFYIRVYEMQEGARTWVDPYLLAVDPECLGATSIEEPKE